MISTHFVRAKDHGLFILRARDHGLFILRAKDHGLLSYAQRIMDFLFYAQRIMDLLSYAQRIMDLLSCAQRYFEVTIFLKKIAQVFKVVVLSNSPIMHTATLFKMIELVYWCITLVLLLITNSSLTHSDQHHQSRTVSHELLSQTSRQRS